MTIQKVALVTGGSKGIGAGIVKKLADQSFAVAINYVSGKQEAQTLANTIQANGGKAIAIQCDVSQLEDVAHMFETAESELGAIDVVINNAGIMKLAAVTQSSDELFDRQVAINFKGAFNVLRMASERTQRNGRIISISSSVVGLKLEGYGVYAATKSAVETMSTILSKELRGKSITVNCVAPGPTATQLFLNDKPKEVVEKLAAMSPLERLGKVEDIAEVVAFLASQDGDWINGQVIRANGGII